MDGITQKQNNTPQKREKISSKRASAKEPMEDKTVIWIKSSVLSVLAVGAMSAAMYWLYQLTLLQEWPSWDGSSALIWAGVTTVLGLALFAFALLLIKAAWLRWVIVLLMGVLGLAFYGVSIGTMLAMVAFIVFVMGGMWRFRRHALSGQTLQIFRGLRKIIPITMSALLLFPAVRLHSQASDGDLTVLAETEEESAQSLVPFGDNILPEGLVIGALKPVEGVIEGFVPGFAFERPAKEFLLDSMLQQTAQQLERSDIFESSDQERLQEITQEIGVRADTPQQLAQALEDDALRAQIVTRIEADEAQVLTDEISQTYGIEFTDDTTMADVVTRVVNQQLLALVGPFQYAVPAVAAGVYYLALRVLAVPAVWAAWLCAWIAFRLLQYTRLFDVALVEKPVEEIQLVTR